MIDHINHAIELEHFITDKWAVDAILTKEILTRYVVDPCAGTGVMAISAIEAGYTVFSYDIHDWGGGFGVYLADFLGNNSQAVNEGLADCVKDSTVFMNPPFSKAVEFVKRSFELGARKVVCFQRFSWWESQERNDFWTDLPPNRIYICGDRAVCWRHDLPKNDRGHRFDPVTGKKLSNAPTAHAWFVWEKGNPQGTVLGHIWKSDVKRGSNG